MARFGEIEVQVEHRHSKVRSNPKASSVPRSSSNAREVAVEVICSLPGLEIYAIEWGDPRGDPISLHILPAGESR